MSGLRNVSVAAKMMCRSQDKYSPMSCQSTFPCGEETDADDKPEQPGSRGRGSPGRDPLDPRTGGHGVGIPAQQCRGVRPDRGRHARHRLRSRAARLRRRRRGEGQHCGQVGPGYGRPRSLRPFRRGARRRRLAALRPRNPRWSPLWPRQLRHERTGGRHAGGRGAGGCGRAQTSRLHRRHLRRGDGSHRGADHLPRLRLAGRGLADLLHRGRADGTRARLCAQGRLPHHGDGPRRGRAYQHRSGRLGQLSHRPLSGGDGGAGSALQAGAAFHEPGVRPADQRLQHGVGRRRRQAERHRGQDRLHAGAARHARRQY